MDKVVVHFKNNDGIKLPQYATEGSAGFDLVANNLKVVYDGIKEVDITKLAYTVHMGYFVLRPFERALIGTGLFPEIPEGYEIQVRSRSGLSLKRGLIVANSPGTIDSDFRGEICVILINNTRYLSRVNFGEAVAQGVLTTYCKADPQFKEELSLTERGEGGFGHTDAKKESQN